MQAPGPDHGRWKNSSPKTTSGSRMPCGNLLSGAGLGPHRKHPKLSQAPCGVNEKPPPILDGRGADRYLTFALAGPAVPVRLHARSWRPRTVALSGPPVGWRPGRGRRTPVDRTRGRPGGKVVRIHRGRAAVTGYRSPGSTEILDQAGPRIMKPLSGRARRLDGKAMRGPEVGRPAVIGNVALAIGARALTTHREGPPPGSPHGLHARPCHTEDEGLSGLERPLPIGGPLRATRSDQKGPASCIPLPPSCSPRPPSAW